MDIGSALSDSLEYAKDAVWGKWVRWILLLVSSIIFPLILGYLLEVLRGKKPAPELANWGTLFIDGIKLFIIGLIYLIPTAIVGVVFIGLPLLSSFPAGMMGYHTGLLANWKVLVFGACLTALVTFIVGLVEVGGVVRFARKGGMGEAFNFGGIFADIGKIGWGFYILALIVLAVVVIIIRAILTFIPVIGWFLAFIATPPLAIFATRYMDLLFGDVPQAPAPPAP